MKKNVATLAVLVCAVGLTGCMNDQTKAMALSCQALLQQKDRSGLDAFIEKAEDRIASLDKPQNKLTRYLRDLTDPGAMTYKSDLEQCLWQLKHGRI